MFSKPGEKNNVIRGRCLLDQYGSFSEKIYHLNSQFSLKFCAVDHFTDKKMVDNHKFQGRIKFGCIDYFIYKKRVDNTKFKTNLTVQAVCM